MQQKIATPIDLKVLMNHIYEYQKGVRRMVLFTFNKKYEAFARTRLERQHIEYVIQPVGNDRLNLFFGKRECLDAIRMIVTKPFASFRPRRISSSGRCWDTTSARNANASASARREFADKPNRLFTSKRRFLFTGDDSFRLMAPFSV